jgi:hypothetical protein
MSQTQHSLVSLVEHKSENFISKPKINLLNGGHVFHEQSSSHVKPSFTISQTQRPPEGHLERKIDHHGLKAMVNIPNGR